jgi:hypothetical protein
VDLVACALCSVLMLLFAALAYRGTSSGGTTVAFTLVTVEFRFDGRLRPFIAGNRSPLGH